MYSYYQVIGTRKQFEEAVKQVIKTVSFHQNNKVQVFELNIRALGGLVIYSSSHERKG